MNNDHHRTTLFLGGLAAGIALMYIADPHGGARRRALARDKATQLLHRTRDFLGKASRDLRHRAQGFMAETQQMLFHPPASDDVVVERVRSRIGHYVSHPRAIDVTSREGRVVLSGPILSPETPKLMRVVPRVPGVREVENHLEEHGEADIPALQGEDPEAGDRIRTWTPGLQLLAGLAVGIGLLYGTRLVRSGAVRRQSFNGRADAVEKAEIRRAMTAWPR